MNRKSLCFVESCTSHHLECHIKVCHCLPLVLLGSTQLTHHRAIGLYHSPTDCSQLSLPTEITNTMKKFPFFVSFHGTTFTRRGLSIAPMLPAGHKLYLHPKHDEVNWTSNARGRQKKGFTSNPIGYRYRLITFCCRRCRCCRWRRCDDTDEVI